MFADVLAGTNMQRSHMALALLPLLLCTAVPPTAAQAPPVGDILSQVFTLLNTNMYSCMLAPLPVPCAMLYWSNLR